MVQSLNVAGIINAFRVLWNPSLAVPHIIVNDIRNIHFEQLKNQGRIQCMAFDKDNCLTAPYVPEIHPPFKATKLEDSLGVPVLRHSEKKPSGGAALAKHFDNVPARNIAVVGDRILTDIIFGNLNGNLTIWTSQIVTEKGDNKAALIFRRMEHQLIRFLQNMNVKPPHHPALKGPSTDYSRS